MNLRTVSAAPDILMRVSIADTTAIAVNDDKKGMSTTEAIYSATSHKSRVDDVYTPAEAGFPPAVDTAENTGIYVIINLFILFSNG